MKRIIFTLLALASLAQAETQNLGYTVTAATGNADVYGAVLYGRDGNALRQLAVNSNGGLPLSVSSLPSVSVGSYTSVTNAVYSFLTESVTTVNLTTLAGVTDPVEIWLTAAQGGAAVRYWLHPSLASAPAAATLGTNGHYCASTTTVQVTGKWAAGTHVSVISVGSSAVNGTISLVK